jgi:hypothetical protein
MVRPPTRYRDLGAWQAADIPASCNPLYRNPLNFIECDFVSGPIIELGGARHREPPPH